MPFITAGIPTWESLREMYALNLRLLTRWTGAKWDRHDRIEDICRALNLECEAIIWAQLATMWRNTLQTHQIVPHCSA